MVLPHAAGVAVPPQREDLPDDHHAAESALSQLQNLCVTDFLHRTQPEIQFHHRFFFSFLSVIKCVFVFLQ